MMKKTWRVKKQGVAPSLIGNAYSSSINENPGPRAPGSLFSGNKTELQFYLAAENVVFKPGDQRLHVFQFRKHHIAD